jgi:transcription initiation factor TFIIB
MDNKRAIDVVLMEPAEQQIPSKSKSNELNDVSYCDQCNNDAVIFDMVSSEYVCSACGCVANTEIFTT